MVRKEKIYVAIILYGLIVKIIFCNNKELYTCYRNQETKWLKGIHAVNILWDSSGGKPLETRQTGGMPKKYLTTSQHIHYTFELFSFLTLKMLVYVGGHVTWDASYRLWCALRRKASHFLQTCRQSRSIWTLIHSSGCSGAGSHLFIQRQTPARTMWR